MAWSNLAASSNGAAWPWCEPLAMRPERFPGSSLERIAADVLRPPEGDSRDWRDWRQLDLELDSEREPCWSAALPRLRFELKGLAGERWQAAWMALRRVPNAPHEFNRITEQRTPCLRARAPSECTAPLRLGTVPEFAPIAQCAARPRESREPHPP